jgi:hypothetical protein
MCKDHERERAIEDRLQIILNMLNISNPIELDDRIITISLNIDVERVVSTKRVIIICVNTYSYIHKSNIVQSCWPITDKTIKILKSQIEILGKVIDYFKKDNISTYDPITIFKLF